METILAVDDEPSVLQSFRMILGEKYRVLMAEHGQQALDLLDTHHVDIMLLDLMMPGMSGMEVLEKTRRQDPGIDVLVVTAMKSVSAAVEAMKSGAREYIIKPFDVEEIRLLVGRTLEERRNRHELESLRAERAQGFGAIIGDSPSMRKTLALAQRATHVDSTVLLTGESGTGKDLLARAIHYGGPRADKAFVAVSSCAIPAQLVESELFGHEEGAFTGAVKKHIGKVQVATGGSLFLDEIGEMPLEPQAKLLRLLQEGQYYAVGSSKVIEADVRFICATNRNLEREIASGNFREDLFYRINVIAIEAPPLRQRREDIPALASHFLSKHCPRVNAVSESFSPDALARLAAYDWPGNVRELENIIERVLVYHGESRSIDAHHFDDILPTPSSRAVTLDELEGLPLDEATIRVERHLLERALARSEGNQSKAAELLGTTRRILKYKMDQLGVAPGAPE